MTETTSYAKAHEYIKKNTYWLSLPLEICQETNSQAIYSKTGVGKLTVKKTHIVNTLGPGVHIQSLSSSSHSSLPLPYTPSINLHTVSIACSFLFLLIPTKNIKMKFSLSFIQKEALRHMWSMGLSQPTPLLK